MWQVLVSTDNGTFLGGYYLTQEHPLAHFSAD